MVAWKEETEMITALLLMYFLGGGVTGGLLDSQEIKQLTSQVEEVVGDKQRLKAAVKTLKQLRKESKSFERAFSKSGKQLTKLFVDHEASADQMRDVIDKLNLDWESSQQKTLGIHQDLKGSLTESEWGLVFDPTARLNGNAAKDVSYSNSIGAAFLQAYWKDPDFDPKQRTYTTPVN
jgi:hypothetical protein